jgi:hypothetical protein
MSLFEFATVMISMILALTISQLLMSASFLAKQRHRVVPYAPYVVWLISLFLTLINHWWALWDLRDIEWTYGAFLYTLLGPTLVFFVVGLLAQERSVKGEIDLRAQFDGVRSLFLTLQIAYVTVLWFDGPLFAEQDPFGIIGAIHIPILGALLFALLNRGRVAQTVVPVFVLAMVSVIMINRALS